MKEFDLRPMRLEEHDFTEDILECLRIGGGRPVSMWSVVRVLTRNVPHSSDQKPGGRTLVRGKILADISRLSRDGRIIRYTRDRFARRDKHRVYNLVRLREIRLEQKPDPHKLLEFLPEPII